MLGDSAVLGTGGGGGFAPSSPGNVFHFNSVFFVFFELASLGGNERGRLHNLLTWVHVLSMGRVSVSPIHGLQLLPFPSISVHGKLADLGYHRNAKKCKEKFENVYKYHKRTKEGRSGKSEGKTYRFFDQLQALENNPAIHPIQSPTPPPSKPPPVTTTALPATPLSIVVTTTPSSIMSLPPTTTLPLSPATVPSPTTLPVPQGILALTTSSFPSSNPTPYFPTQTPNPTTNNTNSKNPQNTIAPPSFPNIPTDLLSNSSSSSTSSEETTTEGGGARRKRKRKWKDFFERLMKEVIEKQEELQRRFLEAIEKREQERVAREETWRRQEMQRISREREILAQERSIAAAKDAAVMAFLQKMAEHQQEENNLQPALNTNNNIISIAAQQPVPQATPTPTPQQKQTTTVPEAPPVQSLVPQPQQHQVQQQQQLVMTNVETNKADNNGENLMMGASSSRWPKVEVQALIDLRTNLETKYQENGPKGPLWEEISALMRKMGYNRNAKRCKEKWENINKYFKKVKESNKKRPEDSKTCPYFHQLEALYKEKNKVEGQMKPESMMAPLMVQPEQQWPPQQVVPPEVTMEDAQNDPMDGGHHEDGEEEEEEEEDKDIGDEDDDEDDEGGNYEIVASKPASAGDASAEKNGGVRVNSGSSGGGGSRVGESGLEVLGTIAAYSQALPVAENASITHGVINP
ncbi:Trihelix transcription factor GT-2 Trihelix DNA-binding protein [Vigna angularis]|uniref:Trihelix transcription factor GT-2 Trihelix DNA-binding protein n=1 Tax=Phaseolus angularis TaxID=3914 RepID=A0A8T0JYB7_PHAAN|nr:Trihelix transcription factor GT-2 Trihelix DNA-binding protein [Vigna angularis]